jgi:hypothetical protein
MHTCIHITAEHGVEVRGPLYKWREDIARATCDSPLPQEDRVLHRAQYNSLTSDTFSQMS